MSTVERGLRFYFAHVSVWTLAVAVGSKESCRREGCPGPPRADLGSKLQAEVALLQTHGRALRGRVAVRQGCFTTPRYASSARKEYSGNRRLGRIMDARRTWCCGEGCIKMPIFRFAGVRRQKVCANHAVAGMVPALYHQCAQENGSKMTTFGNERSRSRDFFAENAVEEMVNIVDKKCVQEGCRKRPT